MQQAAAALARADTRTTMPFGRRHRHMALWLILLVLMLAPALASAACSFSVGTTAPVNFSPPTTITVAFNAPVGTVLYTSPQVAPSTTSQINCTGTSNYGVVNAVGATPATSVTVFPTGIPGLSYSISHNNSSTFLQPYPCCQIAAGGYNLSVTSGLQLIKTGPIVSGSTLNAGALAYWQYDNNLKAEAFTLANSVTILDPACSVDTTAINVTLPTLSNTAFTGVGAVAGSTPFAISLTCSAGATLAITLDTAAPFAGSPGVIAPTTGAGRAKNIGVQLIDKNFTAVSFGTTTTVGATPSGTLTIPYYARYYQTASPVTAGTVTATATFTMSYQ
ncbi:fimbrial protein [Dyella tabacisoli]|uniref:Type 1 fimbrial protein n=1 Tax=Dyella tabacisoli TaxID=2282381 RepID=A0A369UJN0_9GAMM|nr:fimbrial protein [Dyella tabacisoli]RDD80741.1 type 1 fimbrial protein [Dyella tabacisoli]